MKPPRNYRIGRGKQARQRAMKPELSAARTGHGRVAMNRATERKDNPARIARPVPGVARVRPKQIRAAGEGDA